MPCDKRERERKIKRVVFSWPPAHADYFHLFCGKINFPNKFFLAILGHLPPLYSTSISLWRVLLLRSITYHHHIYGYIIVHIIDIFILYSYMCLYGLFCRGIHRFYLRLYFFHLFQTIFLSSGNNKRNCNVINIYISFFSIYFSLVPIELCYNMKLISTTRLDTFLYSKKKFREE